MSEAVVKYAIIVAGGSGSRMGADLPKQFIEFGGEPILMRTLRSFYQFDQQIKLIVVLPESQIGFWKELCEKKVFSVPHEVTSGGETRYHSVSNGLKLVDNEGIVAVHDGVRPFISKELISRAFQDAAESGAAIPVIPSKDSLRKVEGNSSIAVERSQYFLVQTPQCFKSSILKAAYKLPYQDTFTDDASVVEASGHPISLIEGEANNIKITTPFDLRVAEVIINEGD